MPTARFDGSTTHDRETVLVDLALQGGGAHGAYTWGVLDRFLEEPWLRIDGISGTSAGAMNAAALAYGYALGGSQGARRALEGFWRRVADVGQFSPMQRGPLDVLLGRWSLDRSPAYIAIDMMSRLFSPYDLHVAGWNPLRRILTEGVDFSQLTKSPIKLFITVTNVATGRPRVFRNGDLTPDALIASACLPTMFQAIEIDGEAYWDGGYSGNPTITPLVRECDSQDTIIVPINPIERKGTPRSASEILNRLNEVAFNAVLLKELRMIAMLRQVADPGDEEGRKWAGMRVHTVTNEVLMEFSASSKLIAEWGFFCMLRDEGRRSAQDFLDRNANDLGRRSTLSLDALLQGV
jgi:NTE family protein